MWKSELDPYLLPCTEINSRMDKRLKHKTLNFETVWKTLENTDPSNDFLNGLPPFLNRTPIAQEIIARIDKWDCISKGNNR